MSEPEGPFVAVPFADCDGIPCIVVPDETTAVSLAGHLNRGAAETRDLRARVWPEDLTKTGGWAVALRRHLVSKTSP